MTKSKNYIRENLFKLDHKIIMDFIETYNIVYTKNKNGIFFDLNYLNDDHLLKLETMIKCNINNKSLLVSDPVIDESLQVPGTAIPDPVISESIIYEPVIHEPILDKTLSSIDFNEREMDIIDYSKKYKL
tara:strand:- start:323 stop:712 length:390 start_codon:yes stop_codon:yes gene_type:complete